MPSIEHNDVSYVGSLCEQQGIKTESLKEEIDSLFAKTDVHALMRELEKQLPDE